MLQNQERQQNLPEIKIKITGLLNHSFCLRIWDISSRITARNLITRNILIQCIYVSGNDSVRNTNRPQAGSLVNLTYEEKKVEMMGTLRWS